MKNIKISRVFFVKSLAMALVLVSLIVKNASANILIWPTSLQMESNEKTISVWLENHGRETQVYQARVFSWSQKSGDDQLTPQNNIMISPPLIKIAPGEKQMFRIVQRIPMASDQMNTYRVMLDEVPQKVNANNLLKDDRGSQQGLGFQFRYSLPLFVYGKQVSNKQRESISAKEMAKQLTWDVTLNQGKRYLNITNNSNYYVHLSDISSDNSAETTKKSGVSAYVLPKSTRKVELEDGVEIGKEIYGSIGGSRERVQF